MAAKFPEDLTQYSTDHQALSCTKVDIEAQTSAYRAARYNANASRKTVLVSAWFARQGVRSNLSTGNRPFSDTNIRPPGKEGGKSISATEYIRQFTNTKSRPRPSLSQVGELASDPRMTYQDANNLLWSFRDNRHSQIQSSQPPQRLSWLFHDNRHSQIQSSQSRQRLSWSFRDNRRSQFQSSQSPRWRPMVFAPGVYATGPPRLFAIGKETQTRTQPPFQRSQSTITKERNVEPCADDVGAPPLLRMRHQPSRKAGSVHNDYNSKFSDFTHLSVALGSEAGNSEDFYPVLQHGTWGPRVASHLLCLDETAVHRSTADILEELKKTEDEDVRAKLSQTLIVRRIPKLSADRKLGELSECMLVHNKGIKEEASKWLEKTVLELRNSSLKDDLQKVAMDTFNAFLEENNRDSHVFHMLHIHLLAVSALLSRCALDGLCIDPFSAALKQQKKTKKQETSHLKQKAIEALRLFYKFKEPLVIPDWRTLNWCQKASPKRMKFFTFTSFCQHVVNIYTLLNELSQEGWSTLDRTMLAGLQEVYNRFPRRGKYEVCQEVVDFMLVRGLLVLLANKFAQDVCIVGRPEDRDHNELISHILLRVIDDAKGDSVHKKLLMREIRELPFHNAHIVRQIFNWCLSGNSRVVVEFYRQTVVGYLAKHLRLIGFERDNTGSMERASRKAREECSWVDIICRVGSIPAEGVVYVPKPGCLGKTTDDLLRCISDHSGNIESSKELRLEITQKAQKHKQNLDFLKMLSPGCKTILKLMAFQIQPFPFYITEAVEHCRLLEYLIDQRNSHQWIPNSVLVSVIQDVLKGLTYMLEHRIIARDTTAFVMTVERLDHSPGYFATRILSSGNFIVKIADLGLALMLSGDSAEIKVTDDLPVPLRWTASEVLFDGLCSEKSMVYSLGCLMYECWTHGCQPYTEYDATMKTDAILGQLHVSAQRDRDGTGRETGVKLQRWPCIPEDVFGLMEKCTSPRPSLRPSLYDVRSQLMAVNQCDESNGETEPELNATIRWTKKYPPLSQSQKKRRHVPEMGISASYEVTRL